MLSKKLQDMLNTQINHEFFSEYQYLSATAYFESIELDGFANFFYVQSQEEHFHAMKIFNFVNEKNGTVTLLPIKAPKTKFKSLLDVFESSLEQERFITKCINDLTDAAIKENDHSVRTFLEWYVNEQVEEENLFLNKIGKLNLIGAKGDGLLTLDREFAKRKYENAGHRIEL
jgi:ferritin